MNKVINIGGLNYRVKVNTTLSSTCGQCAFYHRTCPSFPAEDDTSDECLCTTFDQDAYFVEEPSAESIEQPVQKTHTTEQTFTESQLRKVCAEWLSEGEIEDFMSGLIKSIDPEYQEYLRLHKKFGN
jgi:hypothetical protein